VARFGSRAAALNRAAMPGCIWPARIRFKPWLTRMRLLRSSLTTSATVPRATRSSRLAKLGSGVRQKATLAQFGTQGEHDVEHDADTGDALGREIAARLIGIDDAIRLGQRFARQMVVGDQRRDAEFPGAVDAFNTGNAVVDRDDQVGRLLRGDIDDFRRQPVTELEAVGQQEIDISAEHF
jgi:hypothetical protein